MIEQVPPGAGDGAERPEQFLDDDRRQPSVASPAQHLRIERERATIASICCSPPESWLAEIVAALFQPANIS